jgi:hypothetical protein
MFRVPQVNPSLVTRPRELTEAEIVKKIADYLDGLESTLLSTLRLNITKEERATLTERRGIYSGMADDVRNGNWKRAV